MSDSNAIQPTAVKGRDNSQAGSFSQLHIFAEEQPMFFPNCTTMLIMTLLAKWKNVLFQLTF
jgi:hypothetical protein